MFTIKQLFQSFKITFKSSFKFKYFQSSKTETPIPKGIPLSPKVHDHLNYKQIKCYTKKSKS